MTARNGRVTASHCWDTTYHSVFCNEKLCICAGARDGVRPRSPVSDLSPESRNTPENGGVGPPCRTPWCSEVGEKALGEAGVMAQGQRVPAHGLRAARVVRGRPFSLGDKQVGFRGVPLARVPGPVDVDSPPLSGLNALLNS